MKNPNACLKCGHDMGKSRCRIAPLTGLPREVLAAYDVRCGKCRKRHLVLLRIPKRKKA